MQKNLSLHAMLQKNMHNDVPPAVLQQCNDADKVLFEIRSVTDSKNLCIGQYDMFFEEYWLSPIL
jgi:hypothetical protein